MDDLIEALQIMRKYENPAWPTNCEHDILRVYVDPSKVSKDDIARLDELGFYPDEQDEDNFISYKFGSC